MRPLNATGLGETNQLGEGSPLVWLWDTRGGRDAMRRRAHWSGNVPGLPESGYAPGDVLDIEQSKTDLKRCREKFLLLLEHSARFPSGD